MKKRILVVDDSAFMRKVLTDQISAVPGCVVIGTARSGEDALKKLEQLKPDAMTLDIVMPGISGLETVKRIRQQSDIPVFIVSSLQGKEITLQALEAGATDFISLPKNLWQQTEEFQEVIAYRMTALFEENETNPIQHSQLDVQSMMDERANAIVIGASTGGPKALLQIIRSLPEDLAIPVFIVQHMPEGFTTSFAKRLDDHAKVRVTEAEHGEKIEAGTVYLAPGNYHMMISQDCIHLEQSEKLFGVRPAVDLLFESAAQRYGKDLLAVIMTGMGKDGTQGMKAVKQKGGRTLAQNQESCVVYGMPGNAVKAGVIDVCINLDEISQIINEVTKVSR